jgi:FkbM family methyltransferase
MTIRDRARQARKLVESIASPEQRRALRHGVFADAFHVRVVRRLAPDFVIDVGANNGQFALAALVARPTLEVLSFEPLPSACDRYHKAVGSERAHVRQIALGSAPGTRQLHVSRRPDSSSLLEMTEVQTSTFPGTSAKELVAVAISTLDEEVSDVRDRTLLKIDVQGYERAVLEGAARTLSRTSWVLCEVSFREFYAGQPTATEVVQQMFQHGFVLAGVEHVTYASGASVQADLLFERAT